MTPHILPAQAPTDAEKSRAAAHLAYDELAPYYDLYTAHHNANAWLGELLAEVERHGLRVGRLLDVGCGTGKTFSFFERRGWTITACDLSQEMVRRARAKAGSQTRAIQADMRRLPRLAVADLIVCLDDALNNLGDVGELEATLAGLRANLAPTGRLVFDLNTVRTYREFFACQDEWKCEGLRMRWRGRAGPDFQAGGVAEAEVSVVDADGVALAPPRSHRHRHFRPAEVKRALAATGLQVLSLSGHDSTGVLERPLDEALHTKAIYVAACRTTDGERR